MNGMEEYRFWSLPPQPINRSLGESIVYLGKPLGFVSDLGLIGLGKG